MSITAAPPNWYRKWYRFPMGMNLRLPDELANRLRSLAKETGKSQQVLVRDAIEMYLRDYQLAAYPPEIRHAITPATTTLREALAEVHARWPVGPLLDGKSAVELIREDRDARG